MIGVAVLLALLCCRQRADRLVQRTLWESLHSVLALRAGRLGARSLLGLLTGGTISRACSSLLSLKHSVIGRGCVELKALHLTGVASSNCHESWLMWWLFADCKQGGACDSGHVCRTDMNSRLGLDAQSHKLRDCLTALACLVSEQRLSQSRSTCRSCWALSLSCLFPSL